MNSGAYQTHLVFERLEQFKQSLKAEKLIEKIGIESFSFFEAAYYYIKEKLKLTNPTLAQEVELTNLAAEIEAGTSQLNTYFGNNNIGHISNAVNNLNSAIARTRNLPIPAAINDFDFSKAVALFQNNVQVAYQQLQAQNERLKVAIVEAQTDLINKQSRAWKNSLLKSKPKSKMY